MDHAINAVPAARKPVRELHDDGVRWSSPGSLLSAGLLSDRRLRPPIIRVVHFEAHSGTHDGHRALSEKAIRAAYPCFGSSPISGHCQSPTACLKGANRRPRAFGFSSDRMASRQTWLPATTTPERNSGFPKFLLQASCPHLQMAMSFPLLPRSGVPSATWRTTNPP